MREVRREDCSFYSDNCENCPCLPVFVRTCPVRFCCIVGCRLNTLFITACSHHFFDGDNFIAVFPTKGSLNLQLELRGVSSRPGGIRDSAIRYEELLCRLFLAFFVLNI